MKVRPKPKKFSNFEDSSGVLRVQKVLHASSAKSLQRSLESPKQTVLVRPESPSTKIRLNIKGNRRGMHAAGDSDLMRKRQAMRRLWNKKMPTLHCSNCQFSSQCPQFRAGYQCAFQPFLDSHKVENEEDLIFYAKELLGENVKRAQLMILMERLSGAKPDLDTSEALTHLFTQLMMLHKTMTERDTVNLEIESSDGTIIGKLFGGLDKLLGSTRQQHLNPISTPTVSGELALDTSPVNKPPADEDLMKELALVRSNSVHTQQQVIKSYSVGNSANPVQEDLPHES